MLKVLTVERRGGASLTRWLDLEGIVGKRKVDPYTPDVVWRKIRNGAYTQMEGRGELFQPKGR